jgi:hypothetical protein
MSEPHLLLDGSLFAEATSEPFPDSRVSSETRLFPGDEVVLTGNAIGDRAISLGVLRMDKGAIAITAHATASEAEITHLGQGTSPPQMIAPTFLARLQAQSQWGLLLLYFGIFLHMLSILRDYRSEKRKGAEQSIEASKA